MLRLALGGVIFPHGAQKLFGWFGGHGFSGTMHHFTENMGIPAVIVFLVIVAESFGALALIAGVLTSVAALGIGVTLTGAALMVASKFGFFMNWFGKQTGEGIEYQILAIAMALVLVIKGGGFLSIDRRVAERLKDKIVNLLESLTGEIDFYSACF